MSLESDSRTLEAYHSKKKEFLERGWPEFILDKICFITIEAWENEGNSIHQIIRCSYCSYIGPALQRLTDRTTFYECPACLRLNEHNLATLTMR